MRRWLVDAGRCRRVIGDGDGAGVGGAGAEWGWLAVAVAVAGCVSSVFCLFLRASLGFVGLFSAAAVLGRGVRAAGRRGPGRGRATGRAERDPARHAKQRPAWAFRTARSPRRHAVSHTDDPPPLAFRVDRRGGPFARRSPSLQRRAGSALSGRPLEPSPRRTRSRPERGCVSADDNPQRCLRPAVLAVPSQPRPAAHLAARGDICSRYLSSRSQGGRRVPACAVSAENTRLPSPAPLSPPGFPTACLLLACLPRWIARRST